MTAPSKRLAIVTALGALLITGLSIVGNNAAIGFPSPGRRLAMLAALPSIPGDVIAGFLGLGHGPDGFPTQGDMVPYVFTFALWWGLLYLIGRRWVRRGATNP